MWTKHALSPQRSNQASGAGLPDFPQSESIRRVSRALPALRKKQVLVRQGEAFHGLYVVRCGMLKQSHWDKDSNEQITHFHFPGDVVGLDAIIDRRYQGRVVALDTVGVVLLSFSKIEEFPGTCDNQLHLIGYLSRAVQREQSRLRDLLSQPTDLRLARFFLSVSRNFQAQGYSPYRFRLPMTRYEVANYLSMAFETTSRLMSRFLQMGIMSTKGHEYCIKGSSPLGVEFAT